MTVTTAGKLRALAVAALMGAWTIAAHFGSSGVGNADVNALLGALPLILMYGVTLWQLPSRPLRLLATLAGAGLLVWLWPHLRNNVALLYYLQHLTAHIALAALFGRSLFGPGEALITRLARSIYDGALSERKVRYTRQATLAWTLFFITNALVSTALFVWAPTTLWSLHANLLTWPLIGLMFLAEMIWRRCVLPPEERPRFADIVTAFRRHGRGQMTP